MTTVNAMRLAFTVHGLPAPQGSKNVNKHGAVYEVSANVKPWREAVKAAAILAYPILENSEWMPLSGPVLLEVNFRLPRPQGHYGTGRNAGQVKLSAPVRPTGEPDLSKLIRSTEDALTDARVWRDDRLVVSIRVDKYYDVNRGPGADITVTEYRRDLA